MSSQQGININETTSIDRSNASYFFAEKNYSMSNPVRDSSVNFKIQPTTSMAGPADISKSTKYVFEIKRDQYGIIDLKDSQFEVSGLLQGQQGDDTRKYKLGCGWLLSLFESAVLKIDECVVSNNRNCGAFADSLAVLTHSKYELTEGISAKSGNLINKIQQTPIYYTASLPEIKLTNAINGAVPNSIACTFTAGTSLAAFPAGTYYLACTKADTNGVIFKTGRFKIVIADNRAVTITLEGCTGTPTAQIDANTVLSAAGTILTVSDYKYEKIQNQACSIQQKILTAGDDKAYFNCAIKLSDLFFEVKSLPPIYNHKITIELTRSNTNALIINNQNVQNTDASVVCDKINHFYLSNTNYQLTDDAKTQMDKYYAAPCETLIQTRDATFQGLTKRAGGTSQYYSLAVEVKYRNTAFILSFPRNKVFTKQINNINVSGDLHPTGNSPMFDELGRPSNCSINPCLRNIEITDSTGKTLLKYDFKQLDTIEGYSSIAEYPLDYKHGGNNANGKYNSYMEAYQDYCKMVQQFGLLDSEPIDYVSYVLEHFMICCDLSAYNLTQGSNINVNMTFEDWENKYNPFYLNSNEQDSQEFTNEMCIQWFGSKALSLSTSTPVMLKNVLTNVPETVEVKEI